MLNLLYRTERRIKCIIKERSPTTHSKRHRFKSSKRKRTTNCYYGWQCLDEPLSASGHNRAWLHAELEKLGVVIENVFLGQVDSYGQLTIDIYNDKLQMPSPQNKPLLLASLKMSC